MPRPGGKLSEDTAKYTENGMQSTKTTDTLVTNGIMLFQDQSKFGISDYADLFSSAMSYRIIFLSGSFLEMPPSAEMYELQKKSLRTMAEMGLRCVEVFTFNFLAESASIIR